MQRSNFETQRWLSRSGVRGAGSRNSPSTERCFRPETEWNWSYTVQKSPVAGGTNVVPACFLRKTIWDNLQELNWEKSTSPI